MRDADRRVLLLHIAVARPYDARELARRTARPHEAVRRELAVLMDAGLVHLHDGALRVSSPEPIVDEASTEQVREIHDQVLAELTAETGAVRPSALVALAESGCREEGLLRLLVRAVADHPDDTTVAGSLATVARGLGKSDDELVLLRAADAAAAGYPEHVLALVEGLLVSDVASSREQAALLAAGAHVQGGRLDRAAAMYRHVGEERIGIAGGWAVLVAVGLGDADAARSWRAAMGNEGLTSYSAGIVDLADGLLESLSGEGDDAVDLLARSISTLAPFGEESLLPESPAALAALVAMGRGEPTTAEVLLDRALEVDLGGVAGRLRHKLLRSWALMMQGRLDAAESGIEHADFPARLCDRDLLLYWCLRAGIARRRTEPAEMQAAWRKIRGRIVGLRVTLYELLALGEMMVVASRLRTHIGRDALRIEQLVQSALEMLDGLGNPVVWAAPLHWHGVQAAFAADEPSALIPHANALVSAGRTSRYAATLAAAGQTWLEMLRGETDFTSVERSARALAESGHVWDASRLAAQAALQHPQQERSLAMMQLAREIGRDHDRSAVSKSKTSVLTRRELEVGRLVLDGQGYRAIGERLFISPKTVEHHVARMRSRLGATSRGELLERLHDIMLEERR